MVLKVGVEQLIQNVAAADGQAGPDVLPGVLGRDQTADLNEAEQRLGVPLLQRFLIPALGLELGQLLVGVIDQGGQLGAGGGGHGIPQHDIHFLADDAGGGVEDVDEGLVLSVQIAHKVLGAFGQFQQGLGTDDLAGGRRLRGIIPGKQRQIFQIFADLVGFGAHGILPKYVVFLHHMNYSLLLYHFCPRKWYNRA